MKCPTWIPLLFFVLIAHVSAYSQSEDVQTEVDKFTDMKTTRTPSVVNTQKGHRLVTASSVVNKKVLMPG